VLTVCSGQSYGVTVSTEMSDNLKHLYGIDATYTTNTTVHDASLEEAQSIVVELVEEPVNEAMSGTLWLFPTAVSGRSVTVWRKRSDCTSCDLISPLLP
jgi:hypothetical protein